MGAEPVVTGMAQSRPVLASVHHPGVCLSVQHPGHLLGPAGPQLCKQLQVREKALISLMPHQEKLIIVSHSPATEEEAQAATEPQVGAW